MEISSIRISRDFQTFLQNDTSSADIILFEASLTNIKSLEKIQKYYSVNKTKFVALINRVDNALLLEAIKIGISSIVCKSEKIEFIVDELKLVLRGKGSFPANIIRNIKDMLVNNGQKESYHLMNIFGKNVFIRKDK